MACMIPSNNQHLERESFSRGKYFAERRRFCLGHFLGAPGQNFCFLVGKLQNLTILRKTVNEEKHFGVIGRISYC